MSIGYSVPYLDLPAPDPRVTGTGPKGAGRGAALLPAYVDAYGNVRRYGVDRGPFASAHGRWGLSGLSGVAGISDAYPTGTQFLVSGSSSTDFSMPSVFPTLRPLATNVTPSRSGGWSWTVRVASLGPLTPEGVRDIVTAMLAPAGAAVTHVSVAVQGNAQPVHASSTSSRSSSSSSTTTTATTTTKRSIVPYAIGALGLVGAAAILLTLPPKRRR